MSDRYLRQLLRAAQTNDIPLTDYVAAALRVMPLEEVLATLQGFSTNDIRQAIKMVWIPAYAAQNKRNEERVALAIALEELSQITNNFLNTISFGPTKDYYPIQNGDYSPQIVQNM